MTTKFPTRINLFDRGQLTVGRYGQAEVERTIDPSSTRLEIAHADRYSSIKAIPLREGESDVVVLGQSTLPKTNWSAKLEHYAKHGGTLEIDGKEGKVMDFGDGILTVQSGSVQRLVNVLNLDSGIKFGAVKEPFVPRLSQTIAFDLGNIEGKDALHLRGSIAATADISYGVTIADASKQDAIKAELQPRLSIANETGADFEKMSLALRLNEPARSFGGPRAARSMGLESVASDDVGEISEGDLSGVITMPVAEQSLSIASGETRMLNFAAAVNGTPNAEMNHVPVTLKQTLSLAFEGGPGKEGKTQKSGKQSPNSQFEMSGTKGPQPAGHYELYDGKDLAGQLSTNQYTEKGKELKINGSRMRSIEAEAATTTQSAQHGTWQEVDAGPLPPSRRAPEARFERTSSYAMKQEIDLASLSQHARTIDFTIQVGAFDQGLSDVVAKMGGQTVETKFDAGAGTLSFRAPIGANTKAKMELEYTGKRTETRFGSEEPMPS